MSDQKLVGMPGLQPPLDSPEAVAAHIANLWTVLGDLAAIIVRLHLEQARAQALNCADPGAASAALQGAYARLQNVLTAHGATAASVFLSERLAELAPSCAPQSELH